MHFKNLFCFRDHPLGGAACQKPAFLLGGEVLVGLSGGGRRPAYSLDIPMEDDPGYLEENLHRGAEQTGAEANDRQKMTRNHISMIKNGIFKIFTVIS
jgi:hypothetical protein